MRSKTQNNKKVNRGFSNKLVVIFIGLIGGLVGMGNYSFFLPWYEIFNSTHLLLFGSLIMSSLSGAMFYILLTLASKTQEKRTKKLNSPRRKSK